MCRGVLEIAWMGKNGTIRDKMGYRALSCYVKVIFGVCALIFLMFIFCSCDFARIKDEHTDYGWLSEAINPLYGVLFIVFVLLLVLCGKKCIFSLFVGIFW